DLSQLIAEVGSFRAILFGFDTVLYRDDAASGVYDLDDGTTFSVAGVSELFDEIVLIEGIGFDFVDLAVKILDFRAELSLCNGGIADWRGGILPLAAVVLQIVGENLQIVLGFYVSPVGGQTVPGQSPGIV